MITDVWPTLFSKVGCQSFNMLLRNLRAAKMRKSLAKNAPIWWQNTPQKHGFDRAHLERIMMLDGSSGVQDKERQHDTAKSVYTCIILYYLCKNAVRCADLTCKRSEVEG